MSVEIVPLQSPLSDSSPLGTTSHTEIQSTASNGTDNVVEDEDGQSPLVSSPDASTVGQPQPLKRKLDETEETEHNEAHSKIRRTVGDHVSKDPSRVMPMTTVVCLHAAVAQKSYGSEKRFLCPPPVVHVDGPVWRMRAQQLSMAIVSETGERSFQQKAPLDTNMTCSFKFLHVAGTAKAKCFQLSLDISEPPPPSLTPDTSDGPTGRVWASFDSAPVTIISKPSKKTAKTRNISSCILAGGPVSLFNRINSQTVRTKYMTIDHGQLCASNAAWSAFNVNVTRRPAELAAVGGPQPVTYGCEIVLSDTHSGISTSPLVIRKVDKGTVSAEDGGPVSQMQKIALQRVNTDGSRHYLSAAGPATIHGAGSTLSPGIAPPAGTHPLLFQSPRVRDEMKDGVRVICDEVDDYLCWTIVGISKFQYTFFDAFGQNSGIPEMPITPFPTLFSAPIYRPENNTVELSVVNFFYNHPSTGTPTPLDVYLGNLGPLHHRVYQTPAPGSTFNRVEGGNAEFSAADPGTNVVIIEMPPLTDVIKALEEDALPPSDPALKDPASSSTDGQLPPSIAGRSLPLLFIRASDGVGYHSGRTIACEHVFQGVELAAISTSDAHIDTGWLSAAHNFTLRVL